MEAFCDKKTSKNIQKFVCNICDFTCCKKGDWNRHIMRQKHINLTLSNACCDKKNIYTCNICDKQYSSRNGLWNHKKKCIEVINEETNEIPSNQDITPELIMSVLLQNKELNKMLIEQNKQNNELQKQMLEVYKNGTITHNTTNNTNSHNKTFNLNVFLNETCKDAMNIMDFVDSIKVQLTDLEKVGKIGYVEGISNIIVKNLNSLDENKRPVHCTDSKREVMYVKDEDKWEKENENKQKLRKAIKHVAHKNSKMLKEFKTKHPDCEKSESKFSDQYNKLIVEAMGGKGDNDLEKEDKIIKNIAKEVIINKD
jgi:hypothetical protein